MADDEFNEYRERLVVETKTIWPPELGELSDEEKARIAQALHAEPQNAKQLLYIRQHTGFRREITVTPEDVERLKSTA
jgi:hypothetical protein